MARPTKLTPATEKVILAELRRGATRTAAFEAAGIARSKISVYLRRFGTFRDAVFLAEAKAEIRMTRRLDKAGAKDWHAAVVWLERRRRDEWGKVVTVDITQTIVEMVREAGLGEDVEAEALAASDTVLRSIRGGRR